MSIYSPEIPPVIDEIVSSFQHLSSWEKRYLYLMELGNGLPRLNPEEYCDENRFRGCQSSIWLSASFETIGNETRLHFAADSDSKIVRGLIAIFHRVYSGQTVDFILNYDINELFAYLELEQHMDSARRNGLYNMEMRINHLARSIA